MTDHDDMDELDVAEFNDDEITSTALATFRQMNIDKPVQLTSHPTTFTRISTPSYYLGGELDNIKYQLEEKQVPLDDLKNKVIAYITALRDKWLIDSDIPIGSADWILLIHRNFALFENETHFRESVMCSPPSTVISKFDVINFMESYLIEEVYSAYTECIRLNLIDDYQDDINKIFGIIYYSSSLIKNLICIQNINQNGLDQNVIDFNLIGSKFEYMQHYPSGDKDLDKSTSAILEYIERKMIEEDLRKIGENLYTKIYTPDGNFSRAWKVKSKIDKFCYRVCSRPYNYIMHKNFNSSPGRPEYIIKMIKEHQAGIFSTIERSRYLFSFRNGIYYSNFIIDDQPWDIFIPHNKVSKYLKPDEYASKYFDNEFTYYLDPQLQAQHPEIYLDLYGENPPNPIATDWMTIPTPHIQQILTHQFNTEPEEIEQQAISRTHYICIGRWCYPVGKHDDWQIVLMIKGIGGTGKSTILKAMHNFWDVDCIGIISNETETTFGMYPLADKFGNLGMDLNTTFKMPATNFQSMTTGEPMSLSVKNHAARQLESWKPSTFLAGNTNLGFSDTNGAIPRRVAESIFSKSIPKDKINDKLNKIIASTEIPSLIHKSIRAYLTTIREHPGANFWSFCPKYFIQNRVALSGLSNSITRFCDDKDYVQIGTDFYCPKETFINAYNNFCKKHNIEQRQFIPDTYIESFETIKINTGVLIHIKQATRPYPRAIPPTIVEGSVAKFGTEAGSEITCDFIFGLDIKNIYQ